MSEPEQTTTTTEEQPQTQEEQKVEETKTEEGAEGAEGEEKKGRFGGGRRKFTFQSVSKGEKPQESSNSKEETSNTETEKAELTPQDVDSLEKDEDVLFEARARLYRLDSISKQWKERGTGTMKLLQHKESKRIRVLMRRDKTYKICANHYVSPKYKLTPNAGSEKTWNWIAQDFADEEMTRDTLACRFQTVEVAQNFKSVFDSSKDVMANLDNTDELAKSMEALKLTTEAAAAANTTTTTTSSNSESTASSEAQEEGEKQE